MMRFFITKNGKKLRCGYTTGSCAAGASRAAVEMLLTGHPVDRVTLNTPKGISLTLDILDAEIGEGFARCAVRKDGGDDPDVTNGILVFATARKTREGISIAGGEGVGRVVKEGLDQPVGAAAINSTPRRMIAEQVEWVFETCHYRGGVEIILSIPGGEALASKTFNPRIGIEGGLSIIGTTGIVEPMSNAALVDTIRLEQNVLRAGGAENVLLCPGNYGEDFVRNCLGISAAQVVGIGNCVGEAIDAAVERGFKRILLVGHVGKLVKLGIGLMNTHSSNGDGRMETLIACALEAGGDVELLKRILNCATTDAALKYLDEAGLLEAAMAVLGRRIQDSLARRTPAEVEIGFICFTNAEPRKGVLTQSANAEQLAKEWRA